MSSSSVPTSSVIACYGSFARISVCLEQVCKNNLPRLITGKTYTEVGDNRIELGEHELIRAEELYSPTYDPDWRA